MNTAGVTARLLTRYYRPTDRARRWGSARSTISVFRAGSPISLRPPTTRARISIFKLFAEQRRSERGESHDVATTNGFRPE